uniref:hypothetical protein n=1 Tax=Candidatus Electrothrix sp. TaxID=2170559 RepID=UPI0040579403
MAVIDFDPRDRAGQPLGEILHKIIYLCPKYVADDTPEPLREWLLAIDDTLDEEVDETRYRPEISSIFDYIEKSCISPRDAAEMKEEAARKEKLKELEDELKAVKSNLDLAKIEERKAIARTMLNNGLSIEQVANCTQLSVEQVTALDKGCK